MKLRQCIIVFAFSLLLPGCASWRTPSQSEMAKVPVVRFGDVAPSKDFVIYYPAGTSLPVTASISGTLFSQSDKATLHVTLKRDLYVYGKWVSFDGKKWVAGRKAIDDEFDLRLPGGETGSNPGMLGLDLNLK